MKSYPTREEINNIKDLLESQDIESFYLALNILISSTFRTDSTLKTAVYHAQNILRHEKYWYSSDFDKLIKTLNRYLNKL